MVVPHLKHQRSGRPVEQTLDKLMLHLGMEHHAPIPLVLRVESTIMMKMIQACQAKIFETQIQFLAEEPQEAGAGEKEQEKGRNQQEGLRKLKKVQEAQEAQEVQRERKSLKQKGMNRGMSNLSLSVESRYDGTSKRRWITI